MINVVCGIKSTGRICTDIAKQLEKQGHEVKIAYGRDNVPENLQHFAIRIGTDRDVTFHGIKARLLDGMGFGSRNATEEFISWVRKFNPDVIHLHNIHGYYLNINVLFNYLKTCGKRIIWTMHDCWSFTGHCMYFNYEKCERWKTGCGGCPQKGVYPVRWGPDKSAKNYQLKRSLFSNIPNLSIVTPSLWLEDLVKQSFMGQYPVQTIHNGIDTRVFKPTRNRIHQDFGIEGKKIILGVAAVWDRRKGLSDFISLANKIDEDYIIVLVGLNQNQIKQLPSNIIGIERTDSVEELVALYSAAYVFVNATYEDNYPTTNIESIACGTPVITYDTGGSPESANMYGITITNKSSNGIIKALDEISNLTSTIPVSDLSNDETIKRYISIYNKIL